jgi:hypothetical protein
MKKELLPEQMDIMKDVLEPPHRRIGGFEKLNF